VKTFTLSSLLFTLAVIVFFGFSLSNNSGDEMTYKNKNASIEERVEDLLKRMTLEEKIEMLGGTGFETKAFERLGIPPLNMTDGPLMFDGIIQQLAIRNFMGKWNPDVAAEFGKVLATETKTKETRNFALVLALPAFQWAENFSFGEDHF
jgi:beta-glucosidase